MHDMGSLVVEGTLQSSCWTKFACVRTRAAFLGCRTTDPDKSGPQIVNATGNVVHLIMRLHRTCRHRSKLCRRSLRSRRKRWQQGVKVVSHSRTQSCRCTLTHTEMHLVWNCRAKVFGSISLKQTPSVIDLTPPVNAPRLVEAAFAAKGACDHLACWLHTN